MSLVPIDRTEVSVVSMLERAKEWLASAVENTSPTEIAATKAQIVTAETYSRELGLSKDIQDNATVAVRLFERALGQAVRRGQADGTIAKRGDIGSNAGLQRGLRRRSSSDDLLKPRQFFKNGDEWVDSYVLADADDETFDAALDEAKAEGKLSRANVVRKVKQRVGSETRDQRAELIADLASQGYSIRQMPTKVGIGEHAIRNILRDYSIDVPAERTMKNTHRHDSNRIASQTVTALEGLVMGIELIDYDDLDDSQASQWADSLRQSLPALNGFYKQIRKATQ